MQISAALVKELRERTGAGMMECKKALVASEGAEVLGSGWNGWSSSWDGEAQVRLLVKVVVVVGGAGEIGPLAVGGEEGDRGTKSRS